VELINWRCGFDAGLVSGQSVVGSTHSSLLYYYYSSLQNLGRGLFFSNFDNFQQVRCPELNFYRIALEVGALESHPKSVVNAIPVFLMPSKNEISTGKSRLSASNL
jgi:hypothetical protein